MSNKNIYAVYQVNWTEYERGWGQRPDGTTYHKTKELAEKYIQYYDNKYNSGTSVPDCYTRAEPPVLVEVSKEIFDEVQKKEMIWK